MNVLITGGAGYIGSHTAKTLVENNHHVVILDNLSTGDLRSLPKEAKFIQGELSHPQTLDKALSDNQIDAVIHCAASIDVAESQAFPMKYFENNFLNTKILLEAMKANSVNRLIFSSTACVYEETGKPVSEDSPIRPISAYGRSKAAAEWMIQSFAETWSDFQFIIFRYFNVAGAEPDGSNGQFNPEASHLIRKASLAAIGETPQVTIFGTDYPTEDGTCIRDFLHVKDLAAIHESGLQFLGEGGPSQILNCGYGKGFSVKNVVELISRLAPVPFETVPGPRRPGDLMEMVADNGRLRATLAWKPKFNDLEQICHSAVQWEKIRHSL